jgi:hypothetical protein
VVNHLVADRAEDKRGESATPSGADDKQVAVPRRMDENLRGDACHRSDGH